MSLFLHHNAALACLSTTTRIASSTVCSTSQQGKEFWLSSSQLRACGKLVPRSVVLKAGDSSGVEPDLEKDYRDIHATAGWEMVSHSSLKPILGFGNCNSVGFVLILSVNWRNVSVLLLRLGRYSMILPLGNKE